MGKVFLSLVLVSLTFNTALANEDAVKAWLYTTAEGSDCDQYEGSWVAETPAVRHEIVDEDSTYVFYEVLCYGGAYNITALYVQEDEYAAEGFRVLNFSVPSVNYEISEVPGGEFGPVPVLDSWSLNGFYSDSYLVNSEFDPEALTITTFSKWRGIGDAFSTETYTFMNSSWVLTKAVVDPTLDGDIQPVTVFETKK